MNLFSRRQDQRPPKGPYLLRIDASARVEGSHSRRLGDAAETQLRARNPDWAIVRRDLAVSAPGHIASETIAAFFTPDDALTTADRKASAQSDALIDELKGAKAVLIAAPMYNFGVPSALKAWIDQIVRVRKTFAYEDGAFSGLVSTPTAVLALAYGAPGYEPGGPFASMNFLEPYLTALMGFIGIADTQVFRVQGTSGDPSRPEADHAAAVQALREAFPAPAKA